MAIFDHKAAYRRDRMVHALLQTPWDERRFMLMSAFQTGELRLSEADEVLAEVSRREAEAAATTPPNADPNARWLIGMH